jgi:hypothetical protein
MATNVGFSPNWLKIEGALFPATYLGSIFDGIETGRYLNVEFMLATADSFSNPSSEVSV